MPYENMTNIVPNIFYLIGRYLFFLFHYLSVKLLWKPNPIFIKFNLILNPISLPCASHVCQPVGLRVGQCHFQLSGFLASLNSRQTGSWQARLLPGNHNAPPLTSGSAAGLTGLTGLALC